MRYSSTRSYRLTLNTTLTVLLALVFFSGHARAGKLRRASEAARSSSSSSTSTSSESSTGVVYLLFELGDGLAAGSCFTSSFALATAQRAGRAGRADGGAERTRFADYPYAHGSEGLLVENPPIPPPPP